MEVKRKWGGVFVMQAWPSDHRRPVVGHSAFHHFPAGEFITWGLLLMSLSSSMRVLLLFISFHKASNLSLRIAEE